MLAAEIRTLSAAGRPSSGACYFIVFYFLRVPTPLNLLLHRVTEDLLCNSHIYSRLKGKKKKVNIFQCMYHFIAILFYRRKKEDVSILLSAKPAWWWASGYFSESFKYMCQLQSK